MRANVTDEMVQGAVGVWLIYLTASVVQVLAAVLRNN